MPQKYPILSCAEARDFEKTHFAGNPDAAVNAIHTAGTAVGKRILTDFGEIGALPMQCHVLVLAGKGNNAGDALIAAGAIAAERPDSRITVVLAEGTGALSTDVSDILDSLKSNTTCTVHDNWSAAIGKDLAHIEFDICIDGLLGMGFLPPLRSPYEEIIDWANIAVRARFRAAIDLPSGLGDKAGFPIFQADITYATGIAKQPCFNEIHRASTGRVRFIDLGFFGKGTDFRERYSECILDPAYFRRRGGMRPADTHKRDYGHLLIVAGSAGMPGAALMATLGALKAGTGLVTALTPGTLNLRLAAAAPEAMWQPFPVRPDGVFEADFLRVVAAFAKNASAILVGPGLFVERHNLYLICRLVREIHVPTVLDASALAPDIIASIHGRPESAGPILITPHIGEFRRISGRTDPKHRIDDPAAAFRDYCGRHHTFGVLKGSVSTISDGTSIEYSISGGPVLARGGTGDILAGMVAGILAQNPAQPVEALRDAVTWHGAAADCLARAHGHHAVRSTQLLDYLESALRAPGIV